MERIRQRLRTLRRRVAAAMAIEGAALLLAILLGTVLLSFALDRIFRLEIGARAALLPLMLLALGFAAHRLLLRRLRRVPGEEPLAVAVERRFPELRDRLISALQLSRVGEPERYGMSPQLVKEAIAEAEAPAAALRFGEILDGRRLLGRALLGLFALLALGAGAVAAREAASTWFRRNVLLQDIRWPQKTYLVVDPERFPDGVARIVKGDDLVVTATSVGEVHPERVTILFSDSEGEEGKATMKADRAAKTYRHEFRDIAFPIEFHLEGGDEETSRFRVEIVEPPEARELVVKVGFPDYSGREPVEIDLAHGDPEVIDGGFLEIRGRASKPLESAALVVGEEEESIPAEVDGDRFSVRYAPRKTALLGLRLRDREGLSNPSLAPRFLVRVGPDREPKVKLALRGIGTMVVSVAGIPWSVRIRDDSRAMSGRLEVSKAGGEAPGEPPPPFLFPLPEAALGGGEASGEGVLEVANLEAEPGIFLKLVAFGGDDARPEAHEGRSDAVALKVVTIEEFLSEMIRRQQEQRRDFEEQYAREKRLREKLAELRAAAGRTPAQVRDELDGQAREQRQIARRAQVVERAMSQILDEMLHNRVVEPSRIEELKNRVVRALETLRTDVLEPHAVQLDLLAKESERAGLASDRAAEAEAGYDRALKSMEGVLDAMVRVEGFTEIVESIRAILRLQGDAYRKTRERWIEEMRKSFKDFTPPEGD